MCLGINAQLRSVSAASENRSHRKFAGVAPRSPPIASHLKAWTLDFGLWALNSAEVPPRTFCVHHDDRNATFTRQLLWKHALHGMCGRVNAAFHPDYDGTTRGARSYSLNRHFTSDTLWPHGKMRKVELDKERLTGSFGGVFCVLYFLPCPSHSRFNLFLNKSE